MQNPKLVHITHESYYLKKLNSAESRRSLSFMHASHATSLPYTLKL